MSQLEPKAVLAFTQTCHQFPPFVTDQARQVTVLPVSLHEQQLARVDNRLLDVAGRLQQQTLTSLTSPTHARRVKELHVVPFPTCDSTPVCSHDFPHLLLDPVSPKSFSEVLDLASRCSKIRILRYVRAFLLRLKCPY